MVVGQIYDADRGGCIRSLFPVGRVMGHDPEILDGLSNEELEALAEGILVPSFQNRLDDLVARSKEGELSADETAELDQLLSRADQLTLVKTRARYTLRSQRAGVSGT